jgi:hypothetical protein
MGDFVKNRYGGSPWFTPLPVHPIRHDAIPITAGADFSEYQSAAVAAGARQNLAVSLATATRERTLDLEVAGAVSIVPVVELGAGAVGGWHG